MILVIKKVHTQGTSYDSIHNDALSKAIKEQYPDLPVKSVFEDFFIDKEGARYTFDTTDLNGYSRRSFKALQDGIIREIRLLIERDQSKAKMYKNLLV